MSRRDARRVGIESGAEDGAGSIVGKSGLKSVCSSGRVVRGHSDCLVEKKEGSGNGVVRRKDNSERLALTFEPSPCPLVKCQTRSCRRRSHRSRGPP